VGHVAGMEKKRNAQIFLVEKLEGKKTDWKIYA
jgi:hypothetical protein